MESLLLSAAGGALGLLLAWGALAWLVRARHDDEPCRSDSHRWSRGGCDAGRNPVVRALFGHDSCGWRQTVNRFSHRCRNRRGHTAPARPRAGLRKVLLVLEVGLTVVFLVGAGLLLKSYERLRNAGLGVPEDNVLTMHFGLPDARYKEAVEQVAFFERLIERRPLAARSAGGGAGERGAGAGLGWRRSSSASSNILRCPRARGST